MKNDKDLYFQSIADLKNRITNNETCRYLIWLPKDATFETILVKIKQLIQKDLNMFSLYKIVQR